MQQIRINQDPYSAEYSRPGRGRIEILTKPGTQEYHGECNADLPRRAPQRAQRVRRDEAAGTAADLRGVPRRTGRQRAARRRSCCRPTTRSLRSAGVHLRDRADRHHPGHAAAVERPRRWSPAASRGRSATGTRSRSGRTTSTRATRTAASAARRWPAPATTFKHHEQQVTYTQQTILRPTLLNQFQMLFGHEREPTTSRIARARHRRRRRVHRRRRAGRSRAHRDAHQPEREPGVDSRAITWCRPAFSCRTGAAAASTIGPTSAARSTSRASTRTPRGTPYAFTQQQGNGDLALLEKQVGTYIKDDWQVRPGLSLGFGLRYDWQNYFHDNNNFAPRVSVAYAPGNNKTNVLPRRHRRLQRSQRPGGDRRRAALAAGRPDALRRSPIPAIPIRSRRRRRGGAAAEHRAARARRADSADGAVQRRPRSSAAEDADAVGHLHRRARLPHVPVARRQRAAAAALSDAARIRRTAPSARSSRPAGRRTIAAGLTLRGRVTRWFNGQMQYTWSRGYNDTNGIGAVSGQRLRPVRRVGARRLRSAASLPAARPRSALKRRRPRASA